MSMVSLEVEIKEIEVLLNEQEIEVILDGQNSAHDDANGFSSK